MLKTSLNAQWPPLKSVEGWKKVSNNNTYIIFLKLHYLLDVMWADFKSHIKAKMRRNKVSVGGTGGGPSGFVPSRVIATAYTCRWSSKL